MKNSVLEMYQALVISFNDVLNPCCQLVRVPLEKQQKPDSTPEGLLSLSSSVDIINTANINYNGVIQLGDSKDNHSL